MFEKKLQKRDAGIDRSVSEEGWGVGMGSEENRLYRKGP